MVPEAPLEETESGLVPVGKYANVLESEPTRYRDGWLPGYARD